MRYFDIAPSRPVRVGLMQGQHVLWNDPHRTCDAVRVRGSNLSEVGRRTAAVRDEQPDIDVVADIDVVIAETESAARSTLDSPTLDSPLCESGDPTLLYVGTPTGLAGLVSDIHAVGIADGAVLIPRTAGVADLIEHQVMPALHRGRAGQHRDSEDWSKPVSISNERYRAALRRHPAGVVVITLAGDSGPVGFTATSFSSLSLNPPLVCFNITHTSSSIAALRKTPTVVVHLLAEHQLPVARRFSADAEQRFADTSTWTTLDSGEPLLSGSPTWMRTTISRLIPAGDSTLVIAEVTDLHCDGDTPDPLVYHDGAYRCARPVGP